MPGIAWPERHGSGSGISGGTAVIGCPGSTTSSSLAFTEHIAGRDGRNTVITRTLQDPAATAGDFFGISVGISGTNIVVGTLGFTGPHNVYIYTKGTSGWPSAPTVTIPDPGHR